MFYQKVNEFQVAFLLPGGQTLNLLVSAKETVGKVKETVCEEAQTQKNALLLNHSAYEFRTYRKNKVLSDTDLIGDIVYILKCRHRCTLPKLVLVQKNVDPFSIHVRIFFLHFLLIGSILPTVRKKLLLVKKAETKISTLKGKKKPNECSSIDWK